jgi:hypothetical protein
MGGSQADRRPRRKPGQHAEYLLAMGATAKRGTQGILHVQDGAHASCEQATSVEQASAHGLDHQPGRGSRTEADSPSRPSPISEVHSVAAALHVLLCETTWSAAVGQTRQGTLAAGESNAHQGAVQRERERERERERKKRASE